MAGKTKVRCDANKKTKNNTRADHVQMGEFTSYLKISPLYNCLLSLTLNHFLELKVKQEHSFGAMSRYLKFAS